ncbi:MAG: hypothetical protein OXM01_14875 [Gemmatimonadota bacterium]|nr:hypothetical protein [Gemmatimonadota bacterium]MDE2814311.1 hypothetical protein [Gemmatimonadota bacterium]
MDDVSPDRMAAENAALRKILGRAYAAWSESCDSTLAALTALAEIGDCPRMRLAIALAGRAKPAQWVELQKGLAAIATAQMQLWEAIGQFDEWGTPPCGSFQGWLMLLESGIVLADQGNDGADGADGADEAS